MKCIAPIIPVWAEEIEIAIRGTNRLIVRGWGRNSYPLIPSKRQGVIEAVSRNANRPMHLQFANARLPQERLEFVRRYGPILGRLEGRPLRKNGKEDLVVREDIGALTREQSLFRTAVMLLSELQAKRQDRTVILHLVRKIRELYPSQTVSDKKVKAKCAFLTTALVMAEPSLFEETKGAFRHQRMYLEKIRYDSVLPGPKTTKEGRERQKAQADAVRHNAVEGAHGVLCDFFNRFPLRMFPYSQGAIELPSYDREGILPLLYYLLRRDYRDQHYLIKVCKVCGAAFKPERGDSDCCERKCYKKYNDRDRYLKNKGGRTAA